MLNNLSSGLVERKQAVSSNGPQEHLHGQCNPASVGLDTWLRLYVGARKSV
jgi:hypothetical protein